MDVVDFFVCVDQFVHDLWDVFVCCLREVAHVVFGFDFDAVGVREFVWCVGGD